MLNRIKTLAIEGANFAFETTLASRMFAGWIKGLKKNGYKFHLIFLWLKNVELAISRVEDRIRMGGHSVPEQTIRRRYTVGLKNFFSLYSPLADSWQLYDNSDSSFLIPIALKSKNIIKIENKSTYEFLEQTYGR